MQLGASPEACWGRQVILIRWRVHPDHTVTDVHFTVDNLTGLIASDGPWAETEHGYQMIMNGFDIVVHQERQSLDKSMIDAC